MPRGLLPTALLVAVSSSAVWSVPVAQASPEFMQRTVDVTHRSGGELAIDARRDLVLTADRHSADAPVRPSVTVVDGRTSTQRGAIPLWTLRPWLGPAGPTPHVPSGLDSDETRNLVVTTNSAAATVTVVPVGDDPARAGHLVPVGAHPFGVAIDERRGLAYVASYGDHRIDIVDVEARRVVGAIGGVSAPTELALDERRGRLYAGNFDRSTAGAHELAVIDTRRRQVVRRVRVAPNSRPAVEPISGTVYAASFATGAIAVIEPEADTARTTIETGSTPHGVGIDRRRDLLYAPNLLSNTVTVIDARTERVVATLPVPGVPLGVGVDQVRGRAWVSLRDASRLVVIQPVGATRPGRVAP